MSLLRLLAPGGPSAYRTVGVFSSDGKEGEDEYHGYLGEHGK